MENSFDNFSSEPRETTDGSIELVSTSIRTAKASPIKLKTTELIQVKFLPIVIDNDKDPSKCVSGKLIYERKKKADEEFPTEKLTRGSVKAGESIEISLHTEETYNLFKGLKDLYELHSDIGTMLREGGTFTRVDNSFRQFQKIISNDPSAARLLGQSENFELVKILLQLITQSESLDSLKNGLRGLGEANISALSNATNIAKLEKVLALLDDNMNNAEEETWQTIFTENQWILAQVFSCPYTIFENKAYVGGKGLNNKGGNICDFIYQNKLTQNIALIEIKTPCTDLLGKQYRGKIYSLSTDMSGAVNQILNYRDSLTKEYCTTCNGSDRSFELLNPKCVVVIGKISSLKEDGQMKTFENYRNSLSNVTVITFDELRTRVNDMLQLFSSDVSQEEDEMNDYNDEDSPF